MEQKGGEIMRRDGFVFCDKCGDILVNCAPYKIQIGCGDMQFENIVHFLYQTTGFAYCDLCRDCTEKLIGVIYEFLGIEVGKE